MSRTEIRQVYRRGKNGQYFEVWEIVDDVVERFWCSKEAVLEWLADQCTDDTLQEGE